MIVSASRRTDIPAFYGRWFERRLSEGFALSVNPMNPKQVRRVSLTRRDVDLFVFWSKQPEPFLHCLSRLEARGFRSLFLFTLNDYPRPIEPRLPPLEKRIETFLRIADMLGPERVVWRYDPVVLSNVTPPEYHAEHFSRLAERLNGSTVRVAVSFMSMYRKMRRRLAALERAHSIRCIDARTEMGALAQTARALAAGAQQNVMQIYSCAESVDLSPYGIPAGACIDPALASRIAGRSIGAARDGGQRGGCRCVKSVDIGAYDTCRFGCAYCYATSSEGAVQRNIVQHHAESPALVGRPAIPPEKPRQLGLWEE